MKLLLLILCLVLILVLLCSVLVSCSAKIAAAPTQTAEKETAEAVTETKSEPVAYPCETDPDLSTELSYKTLSRKAMETLPVASDDMTAMEKRKLCLDYFQMQLSFLWETNLDVTDYYTTYAKQFDDRALLTGNTYAGIPYQSSGNGNLYRILEYYDEKTGVLDLDRAFAEHGGYGEGGEVDSLKLDKNGNVSYKRYRSLRTFFNSCSSGSAWAWARVINTADYGATTDINVNGGFIPVGCYTYKNMEVIDKFGSVTIANPTKVDTGDVILQIGEEYLYHCYALCRPADCVVSPGHVMMVKKVNLVRRADGTPDPQKSKVILMDQGENWSVKTEFNGKKLYRQGGVDRVFTFDELRKSNYLPFTFAELLDESDPFDQPHLEFYKKHIAKRNIFLEKYTSQGFSASQLPEIGSVGVEKAVIFLSGKADSLESLAKLKLGCNYPISDVFVRVKSANGKALVENVYRATSNSARVVSLSAQMSNAKTGENDKRPSLMTGVAEAVSKGGKLEISVQVSTGELLTLEGLDF